MYWKSTAFTSKIGKLHLTGPKSQTGVNQCGYSLTSTKLCCFIFILDLACWLQGSHLCLWLAWIYPTERSKGVLPHAQYVPLHICVVFLLMFITLEYFITSKWPTYISSQVSTCEMSQITRKLQKGCCSAIFPPSLNRIKCKAPLRRWKIKAIPDSNKSES